MADLKTTQETTRSPIDGTELIRLATVGGNWKITITALFNYINGLIVSGVSSVAGKTGAVTLVQNDIIGLTTTDWPVFQGVTHTGEQQATTTFASLASAAAHPGAVMRISDCSVTNLMEPAAGGGSNLLFVQSDGTIWRVFGPGEGGRRLACGELTIYVSTTGSDTTGLGTAAAPFATVQRAFYELTGLDTFESGIDTNGWGVTIQIADGFYDLSAPGAAILLISQAWVGGSSLTIRGNPTTPANVIFKGPGMTANNFAGFFIGIDVPGPVIIQGINFANWHLSVHNAGVGLVFVEDCTHGHRTHGGIQNTFEASGVGADLLIGGNDTLVGHVSSGITTWHSHIWARSGGKVRYAVDTVTNSSGLIYWQEGFILCSDAGSQVVYVEPGASAGSSMNEGVQYSGDSGSLQIWRAGTNPDIDTVAFVPTVANPGNWDYLEAQRQGFDVGVSNDDSANIRWWRKAVNVIRVLSSGPSGGTGGDSYVQIQAPSSAIIDTHTITLPPQQGSDGAVLTNDGSGTLRWSTITASSNMNWYVSQLSGTIGGGANYNDGTYTGTALTGGSGTGAAAEIVVAGNVVTTVRPSAQGTGYLVGNVLSAPSSVIGSSGAGFTYTLTAIGNDATTNTGSSLSPFSTLTRAITEAAKYDYGDQTFSLQINVDHGIYSNEGSNVEFVDIVGCNVRNVIGSTANPANVVFKTGSDVFEIGLNNNDWTFRGMKLWSTGAGGAILTNSYTTCFNMHFQCPDYCLIAVGQNAQIVASPPLVVSSGTAAVTNTAGFCRCFAAGSGVNVDTGITINSTNWAMTQAFIVAQGGGQVGFSNVAITGSSFVTGGRYRLQTGATYAFSGASPTLSALPGSSDGTIDTNCVFSSSLGTKMFKDVISSPSSLITPSGLGMLCIEASSNASLTFRYMGSDGTVRSNTITLTS